MTARPVRLSPTPYEKVWGATALEPWFADSDRKIGEFWFPAEDILVKFLFTSERLSVQVHPDDARAPAGCRGKTEMWHILRAAPGASIALGFREPVSRERAHATALSGEILDLLAWLPVSPGETYFTPAGVVHAIGAGVALCEIQQNSDVTYRLYDYGRPRELHLEQGLAVAQLGPHVGLCRPVPADGVERLVSCPYFITDLLDLEAPREYQPEVNRYQMLIAMEGAGRIDGSPVRAGELYRVPPGAAPFPIEPDPRLRLLRTMPPGASG